MKINFKRRTSFNQRGPNAIWMLLLLLAGFFFYLFWYNQENREIGQLSYSELLTHVQSDNVRVVEVRGQYVHGQFKDKRFFNANIAPSEHFWQTLFDHHVNIQIIPEDKQSWSSFIFLMLFMFFLASLGLLYMRQNQGSSGGPGKIFSIGKSKARFFSPNTVNVTFKDVAGVQEAKENLVEIIEFLKTPEKFERLGAKIPRGVLLNGAPGNGKTLLAKAVAGEAHCPFFSISGSDFVEVFVGVGASRVRDLFIQARKHSPCIVFIDEIDAIGRQRSVSLSSGNDEREQTLNQLLSEMDGFATEHGAVILLAATNRMDVLDKALLRPGRFDRIIEVSYPDIASRQEILNVYAKKVKLGPDVDLKKIARGTPGFSGADLENLINESALSASKNNKEFIEIEDFEFSRDKLLLGAERRRMIISDAEKKRTAFHEAGHTLLNLLLPETDPFHKVTIIPRGRAMGVSWSLPEMDTYSQKKIGMISRIMVAMGGRLSEKLFFDEQTTGASNDLHKATEIAKAMVCKYGMSDLGPIVFSKYEENSYLGSQRQVGDYSENTAEQIDKEIAKILRSSEKEAEKLILQNKEKLEKLAITLLEKETLQAEEVYALLDIEPRATHSLRN